MTDGSLSYADSGYKQESLKMESIIKRKKAHHNAICSREALSADGRLRRVLDEDKKVRVQMHLVKAIQTKWRELI